MSSASKGRYRENLVEMKLLNEGYIVLSGRASKSRIPIKLKVELDKKFGDYPKPDLVACPCSEYDGLFDWLRSELPPVRLIAVVDKATFSKKKIRKVLAVFNFSESWNYEVWIYKGQKKFEIIA